MATVVCKNTQCALIGDFWKSFLVGLKEKKNTLLVFTQIPLNPFATSLTSTNDFIE